MCSLIDCMRWNTSLQPSTLLGLKHSDRNRIYTIVSMAASHFELYHHRIMWVSSLQVADCTDSQPQ
jgi:hypothetical protein